MFTRFLLVPRQSTACYSLLLVHVTKWSSDWAKWSKNQHTFLLPCFPVPPVPLSPLFFFLPLFTLVTPFYPCYPLLPLVTIVTRCYPCYPCYLCYPFVTLVTLVTLSGTTIVNGKNRRQEFPPSLYQPDCILLCFLLREISKN